MSMPPARGFRGGRGGGGFNRDNWGGNYGGGGYGNDRGRGRGRGGRGGGGPSQSWNERPMGGNDWREDGEWRKKSQTRIKDDGRGGGRHPGTRDGIDYRDGRDGGSGGYSGGERMNKREAGGGRNHGDISYRGGSDRGGRDRGNGGYQGGGRGDYKGDSRDGTRITAENRDFRAMATGRMSMPNPAIGVKEPSLWKPRVYATGRNLF